ncbi:Argininosuccinate synthase [Trichinella spiralis]|uniref:Argininosuccinate synthase n=1 Tax=Trichinella spiralis TaxID=6334 RepID=A0ABR3KN52_TRISP
MFKLFKVMFKEQHLIYQTFWLAHSCEYCSRHCCKVKYLFNLALFLRLVSVYQGTICILAKEATLILLNEI